MEGKSLWQSAEAPGRVFRQRTAAGLLALSLLWNVVQAARINRLETARLEAAAQLVQAEQARARALEKLDKMTIQMERERQKPTAQAMAYVAVDAYRYIGACTITAYCPCEECCGQWADGLTATGIPAEPGIVAVDPAVIPIGSTVIIDGRRYLAADTGVTGLCVDICVEDHQTADDFGIQTAEVWVERKGDSHG